MISGRSDGTIIATYGCVEDYTLWGCERKCQCDGQWLEIDREANCRNGMIIVITPY